MKTKIKSIKDSYIFRTAVFFILILITLLLIFKNDLFYNYNVVDSKVLEPHNYVGYEMIDGQYVPQGDAYIYIDGYNANINESCIFFEKDLQEAPQIELTYYILGENGVEEKLVETKNVRKNFHEIQFHSDQYSISAIKIRTLSEDGTYYLSLPNIVVNIYSRSFCLLKKDLKWVAKIMLLAFVSLIISAFVMYPQKTDKMVKTERKSNLELLRVICMLALIGHHLAVHGGALTIDETQPYYIIGTFFVPIGRICFIAFIALSMYFLVDMDFSAKRFLKVWMQVIAYSVLLTVVAYFMGANIKGTDFISSFFVMIGNNHGFAASYLIFLLLHPFVQKLTKNLSKKNVILLIVILAWIQVASGIMKTICGYDQPVHSEVTLFVLCYMISLYLKKWPFQLLYNNKFLCSMFVFIYSIAIISRMNYSGDGLNVIKTILGYLCGDASAVISILGGYLLFYLFYNLKIERNNMINKLATVTFGILLIHDHNFLRQLFWNEYIRTQDIFNYSMNGIRFFVDIILIYFVLGMIDYIRQNIFEVRLIKSDRFKIISEKIDGIFK
ncbi:MAG: acyltransferase [Lachnospiraceae bacterium]|nr:acyltransferase [Lachnospiraceae bacterium]